MGFCFQFHFGGKVGRVRSKGILQLAIAFSMERACRSGRCVVVLMHGACSMGEPGVRFDQPYERVALLMDMDGNC